MAKKKVPARKAAKKVSQIRMLLQMPSDWRDRIDELRTRHLTPTERPFSAAEFIRDAIRRAIDVDPARPLSEPPTQGWAHGHSGKRAARKKFENT